VADKLIRSEADLPPSFTLYLRSFLDDASQVAAASPGAPRTEVPSGIGLHTAFAAADLLASATIDTVIGHSGSLEEVMVAALWPFDPVIALGKAGALRLEVSDHEWKSSILQLWEAANRIVVMVSFTSGLAWELQEIFARHLHSKLILVIPPELPHQTARRWGPGTLASAQMMERWEELIKETPLAGIPVQRLESAVVIRFLHDGSPVILSSAMHSSVVYRMALRAACLPVAKLEHFVDA
jgi:hypothetical protein